MSTMSINIMIESMFLDAIDSWSSTPGSEPLNPEEFAPTMDMHEEARLFVDAALDEIDNLFLGLIKPKVPDAFRLLKTGY